MIPSFALALSLACPFVAEVFAEDAVPGPSPKERYAAAKKALSDATSITVYSVASEVYDHFGNGRPERSAPADSLDALVEGDGVFGSVVISDSATIETIRDAFLRGYLEEGPAAFCYDPHHILHVKGGGGELQIHLCFSCHYAAVLLGPATRYDIYQDVAELGALLDSILARAKIPVKQPWKPFAIDESARDYVRRELGNDLVVSLESADRLELYSLDPTSQWSRPIPRTATGEELRTRLEAGEGVFGSTRIQRDAVRKELLAKTFAAIRVDAQAAKCFLPRHALVFTHATRTLVVLVCFECDDLYVVADSRSEQVPIKDVAGLAARLNEILGARGIAVDR